MPITIDTPRFHLRELSTDDVSERYRGWFLDPDAKKYISAAATPPSLEELRQYVAERMHRADVLFLGIFVRESGVHVGTIKYEPVDRDHGYAVMGILIGEPAYRGQGTGREVLGASAAWLRDHRGISQIILGVDADNVRAVRAYQAAGFVIEKSPFVPVPAATGFTMVKRL